MSVWSGIWHYTQTLGCRKRRVDVAVLTTSGCDHAKSSSTSWVHLYHHRVVMYNFDIQGRQHYRVCDVQCSIGVLKRQSTVGFPGANISDQSQACETRSCLFLYLCSEVEVYTDIYIQHTTVGFVSLLKISELYIISKSYGGPYKEHIITAHVLQQTTPYRL